MYLYAFHAILVVKRTIDAAHAGDKTAKVGSKPVRYERRNLMIKLTSDAIEVVNRNALVTVALSQGYNAYLPVYDNGIDLILLNEATGDTKLVQLKGRWTIDAKYVGRNIWIAFPDRGEWYVAPHDEMVRLGERHTGTESWAKGTYSKGGLSKSDRDELAQYKFGAPDKTNEQAAAQGEA